MQPELLLLSELLPALTGSRCLGKGHVRKHLPANLAQSTAFEDCRSCSGAGGEGAIYSHTGSEDCPS